MIIEDHLSRKISINNPPNRVISLVPSLSELIVDMNGIDSLIGVTKFCVHPSELKKRATIVGGTKNINIDKIEALNPDLIIANKEENTREQIELLSSKQKVYISDIQTFEQSIESILTFGKIFNKRATANSIKSRVLKNAPPKIFNDQRVLYLIWKSPYMTVGPKTYIADILDKLGLKNAYQGHKRYPEITVEELRNIDPDLIFLSSEPFPFTEKHILDIQQKVPNARVLLVDGEAFSWYGSRLGHLEGYFLSIASEFSRY